MRGRRGVSELVSFTLVFSTIIFVIGAVTVTGITTLNDVQAGTESNVAEATMRSLAGTLSDHRTASVPSRSATIKLQGHSFRRLPSSIAVNVTDDGGTSNLTLAPHAFVRTTDTDTRLVYESGAVYRIEDDGGFVIVRRPPLRCTADSAHVPLTLVRGDVNITADGRVTMRSELANQSLRYPANTSQRTAAESVTVNTSGLAVPEGWARVFETTGNWRQSGPDSYQCEGVDRVVVHETVLEVDLVV